VLDAPEYLQLHAAIDLFSSLPSPAVSQVNLPASSVFWLDQTIVEKVIVKLLADRTQADDARDRRIREVKEEGWDLFLRILADGSVLVTAVAVRIFSHPCLIFLYTLIKYSEYRPPTSDTAPTIHPPAFPTVYIFQPTFLSVSSTQS
jgi:hypothetical protein